MTEYGYYKIQTDRIVKINKLKTRNQVSGSKRYKVVLENNKMKVIESDEKDKKVCITQRKPTITP